MIQLREEIAIELLEPQAAAPDAMKRIEPDVVPPPPAPTPAAAAPAESSTPPRSIAPPPPAPAAVTAVPASTFGSAPAGDTPARTAGDVMIAPMRTPSADAPRRAPESARPTAFLDQGTDEFRARALEKTRSAIWPLAMAIGVGLVVGFAAGYGTAMRDRVLRAGFDGAPPAQVALAPAAPATGSSAPPVAPSTSSAVPGAPSQNPTDAVAPGAPIPSVGSFKRDEPARDASSPVVSAPAQAKQDDAKRDAAAALAGRLLIRSTPAGARVSVDGRDAGVTPATVRELARGPHVVRVTSDGYTTEERRIVLTDDRMAQSMHFDLVRKPVAGAAPPDAAGSGALTVESRPSGASVFVDGKLIGTTPLTLESVGAGDHSIGIEQAGYERWVASVRVTAGERARVTASLER